MHTDLSPHLHTPHCNEIIEALLTCRRENKFARFVGVCTTLESEVWKCLKKERRARAAANRAAARARQESLKSTLHGQQ